MGSFLGPFGPRRENRVRMHSKTSSDGHDARRPPHAPRRFGAQNAVEAELDKRGGKNFGPPNGNKMTFFIDDMSMPEVRSRRPFVLIRHRRDSPPSHDDVGGLIFDFGRISGEVATRHIDSVRMASISKEKPLTSS